MSSASIYAPTPDGRVAEYSAFEANSPYARTELMMEQVLQGWPRGEGAERQRVIALRSFNPIGADSRLRTGLQNLNPSHVLGQLIEAHGDGTCPCTVTGVDRPTRDGSGIRDYVHGQDLAEAHVAALLRFDEVIAPDAADRYRAVNRPPSSAPSSGATSRPRRTSPSCPAAGPGRTAPAGRS
ncbi:NAD-dependent epimerase/dehydratase family protein [Kitasatospora sp. NPDC127059]|uniref:NAD-dependent epimerase/dehydratase family protein n=1 Tax=Kitasatospora sp. NPDC127059 TaxID=3347120 RepID=UPI003666A63B